MKISEEYRALALDALRGKWKTAGFGWHHRQRIWSQHCKRLIEHHISLQSGLQFQHGLVFRFEWRKTVDIPCDLRRHPGSRHLHCRRICSFGLRSLQPESGRWKGCDYFGLVLSKKSSEGRFLYEPADKRVHFALDTAFHHSGSCESIQLCDDPVYHGRASVFDCQ